MDEKKNTAYDAVVILETPIRIVNDRKETIQIFGLLYERDMRKRNDLFVWSVQVYYLPNGVSAGTGERWKTLSRSLNATE